MRTQTHTQGGGCVKTGKVWSEVSASEGTLMIASPQQKLGEGHVTNSSSEPPKRTNLADTLILDFWLLEM